MKMPLLSVIVPVYGTEKYLKRCLDSILLQSYNNIEVIVVDDCSPDNSSEIIRTYCERDQRVHMIKHEKNRGLFQARVTGADRAIGKYIAFVDSDDHISIDFYRELICRAEEGNFDIVAGNTMRETQDGKLSQYTLHKICFSNEALYGEEVRNSYYFQEGSCYAWHTIWNKLYRKVLWDKCSPEYHKVTNHLIMTEDVAFSSLLFYHAESFTHVDSASCYFYFANETASTNAENVSFAKFKKNIEDITLVFNFVEDFLKREKATAQIQRHFANFRKHYYRIWKNLQEKTFVLGEHAKQAKILIEALGKGENGNFSPSDFYYESLVSNAYFQIEEIKRKIVHSSTDVVSFDIFDTLVVRPLWNPEDIFVLMQEYFEKKCPEYQNISYKILRKTAESQARRELYYTHPGYEDVTLEEIYQTLSKIIALPPEYATILKEYEEKLEINLIKARDIGKELFEFAKACEKRIVLISDMYLDLSVIEAILQKCGYSGYERLFLSSQDRLLKHSGNLFDFVVSELAIRPNQILHIGDNWEIDINCAQRKGFKTVFLPKTKDRFCNTIPNVPTNRCATIGCIAGSSMTTWDKLFSSLGFRSMMALVANKAFDNPFVSWNATSDFDANPFFMGYYAVGMHLLGVGKWLSEIVKRRGIQQICFLSRDGYLPLRVMEIVKSHFGIENTTLNYVPCSRLSVLPWMIENKQGLLALPIEYRNHTPLSITKMLTCCYEEAKGFNLECKLKKAGFIAGKKFASEKEYYNYILWFQDHMFDEQKLEQAKKIVSAYYQSNIPANSLVFDLGYSGRIPDALQKCLQYPVVFSYIHHDNSNFYACCRRNKLDIEVMYNFIPQFSDLVREYFLSEVGNSCVGLSDEGGKTKPIFINTDIPHIKRFACDKIVEGACQFARDYVETFGPHQESMCFDPVQVSMPFEGLIHISNLEDRRVFMASASDDTVYGQNDNINMSEFWMSQVDRSLLQNSAGIAGDYYGCIQSIVYGKGKFSKAVIYAICDRKTLKDKVKTKLENHPIILSVLRKMYRTLKFVRNKVKGG